ncbi:hypothetical protein SLG_19110 [Sphingobium sp. SYK-6]|uniref:hypothetical protein n=1 Tax=Sphingobium sp. (strain NBRC 103272 / SYK-6) TaxID=627192 RepID=UPI0002277460|nr:hypothetical protein [Sphingobium sp. SYK-6]BAK66586.1 hypothetical protein SLG_19110 [Sphingobium sp. SYK-6]
MWRLANIEFKRAGEGERSALRSLCATIMKAHDLVGVDGRPCEAAEELRKLAR